MSKKLLFDHKETGIRRVSDFGPTKEFGYSVVPNDLGNRFSDELEFRSTLKVANNWWLSSSALAGGDGALRAGRERSEMEIRHFIFGPAISALSKAFYAAQYGSRADIEAALYEVEKELNI